MLLRLPVGVFPFRFMMHRKRGLRMIVLSVLSGGPKNGMELMNDIEEMTRGWWRPTPGSIYPLLKSLTEEGLIRKTKDEKYELTAKASDQMEWSFGPPMRRPQSTDDMIVEMDSYVSYFEELARSDKSKLTASKKRIGELAERLSKLSADS